MSWGGFFVEVLVFFFVEVEQFENQYGGYCQQCGEGVLYGGDEVGQQCRVLVGYCLFWMWYGGKQCWMWMVVFGVDNLVLVVVDGFVLVQCGGLGGFFLFVGFGVYVGFGYGQCCFFGSVGGVVGVGVEFLRVDLGQFGVEKEDYGVVVDLCEQCDQYFGGFEGVVWCGVVKVDVDQNLFDGKQYGGDCVVYQYFVLFQFDGRQEFEDGGEYGCEQQC